MRRHPQTLFSKKKSRNHLNYTEENFFLNKSTPKTTTVLRIGTLGSH
jgi:hypothetical protein